MGVLPLLSKHCSTPLSNSVCLFAINEATDCSPYASSALSEQSVLPRGENPCITSIIEIFLVSCRHGNADLLCFASENLAVKSIQHTTTCFSRQLPPPREHFLIQFLLKIASSQYLPIGQLYASHAVYQHFAPMQLLFPTLIVGKLQPSKRILQ